MTSYATTATKKKQDPFDRRKPQEAAQKRFGKDCADDGCKHRDSFQLILENRPSRETQFQKVEGWVEPTRRAVFCGSLDAAVLLDMHKPDLTFFEPIARREVKLLPNELER